jgi:CheY-like chemotaxis protein
MDGPSTLLALRQMPQFVSTPVIFMTAKVQAHEVARYKSMGGLDVISKPFDPMTLSDSIVEIWTRHHG